MGGMDQYIRIRADEVLKRVLNEEAAKHHRSEGDHARRLLALCFGLVQPVDEADLISGFTSSKKGKSKLRAVHDSTPASGGPTKRGSSHK